MRITDTQGFIEDAVQEKLKQSGGGDPAREIAIEIFQFLLPKSNTDTTIILAALSMVLATLAVEAGMEEEKSVYAFRKSYSNAKRRLKNYLLRSVQ